MTRIKKVTYRKRNLFPLQIFLMVLFYAGILAILDPSVSTAQGSGDAGIQMSGDMDPRARSTDTPTRLYFLQGVGLGADNTLCLTSEFQMDWNVWGGINLWFAVPYHYNRGDLAAVSGLGDLRVIASHTLAEKGAFATKVNFGAILPSGNAGRESEGKSLPMVYQASQGNTSLMVSASLFYRLWSVSAAYQWHISGNHNNFTQSAWGNSELVEEYSDSPGLWCGDDISLRVQKNFDFPKIHYFLSLLPAVRLNEDRIRQGPDLVVVEGSNGFYMNVSAGIEVFMGHNGYFHFLAAVPVLERDVYPDGLDRAFMGMVGFGIRFPE